MKTEKTLVNHIKMHFPSLSVNESAARSLVAAFVAQADPTTTEMADIKCAVSEAVTNSIVHAYRDCIGEIYISVFLYEGRRVKIVVRDRGCGIEDVARARQPLFTTSPESERSGMGFTVMESFTDHVSVRSTLGRGTTITLIKGLGERPAVK